MSPRGEGALVSVIVPTYNRHTTLIETLRSVAEQDYRPLEVVVVDDGSDQPVNPETIRTTITDCQCQVIRLPDNSGPAVARNVGITESTGEFVCFVDDDDLLKPGAIRRRVSSLEAADSSVGVCYCGLTLVTPDDEVLTERCPDYEGDVLREIIRLNFVGTTSSIMCRSSVLAEVGGFDAETTGWEDWDFLVRVAEEFEFAAVTRPDVVHRASTAENYASISNDLELLQSTAYPAFVRKHAPKARIFGWRFHRRMRAWVLYPLFQCALRQRSWRTIGYLAQLLWWYPADHLLCRLVGEELVQAFTRQ